MPTQLALETCICRKLQNESNIPNTIAAAAIPPLPPLCRRASLISEYIACSAFSFCTRANVLAYSCARKSSGSSLPSFLLFVLAHLLLPPGAMPLAVLRTIDARDDGFELATRKCACTGREGFIVRDLEALRTESITENEDSRWRNASMQCRCGEMQLAQFGAGAMDIAEYIRPGVRADHRVISIRHAIRGGPQLSLSILRNAWSLRRQAAVS